MQWRKVQEGPDRPSWNIQRGHFNINKLPRFCCRSQVGAVFIWGLTASHLGQISTGIMWDDVWGHQTCVAGTVDIDLGFLACVPNMYLANYNPVYLDTLNSVDICWSHPPGLAPHQSWVVAVYTRRDTRPGHKARVLAPKLDNTRTLVMVKTLRSPGGARRRQRDQAHTGGDNVTIVQNKIGLCAEK